MFVRKADIIRPSYHQGFARSAGESKHPGLWKGLVGVWCPFLGVTGNRLIDQSAYRNDGTLTDMDPATDWVIDENGYALDFDGSNDYVSMSTGLISSYPVSFVSWVKTSDSATRGRSFLSIGSSVTIHNFVQLQFSSAHEIVWSIRDVSAGTQMTTVSPDTYNDGIWHLAAGVSKASNDHELFIDGISVNTSSTNEGMPSLLDQTSMGALNRVIAGNFFPGQIGLSQIYNRALSPLEIFQLYTNPYAIFELRDDIYGFVPTVVVTALSIGDTSVLFLKPRKSANVLQQIKTVSIQQPRKSVKTL